MEIKKDDDEDEEKRKLSKKLKLLCEVQINNNIFTKNDPTSFLIKNFEEIEPLLKFKKFPLLGFNNKNTIHDILYYCDQIITINDFMKNDLTSNFYLVLLIRDQPDLINYSISLKYIQDFSEQKKNEKLIYNNLINAKATVDLINNYNNCDTNDRDTKDDIVSNLKNENIELIKNIINKLKKFDIILNLEDVIEMNIDELYIKIIIILINTGKLSDYEFAKEIFLQLKLDEINIPILINELIFKKILETLNTNNQNIKKYIITKIEDSFDKNIINFLYLLLNYIFKNPIYIYNIPLLSQTREKIVEFVKSNEFIELSVKRHYDVEKFENVIHKLLDSEYYSLYYLDKKRNYIYKLKSEILENSITIFDLPFNKENEQIIEIKYGDKTIIYNELLEMQSNKSINNNNNDEDKSELTKNFCFFMNLLQNIQNLITSIQFPNCIQLQLKTRTDKNANSDTIITYNFIKENKHTNFETELPLSKEYNNLEGLKKLMVEIMQYKEDSLNNSIMNSSKNTMTSSTITPVKTKIGINPIDLNQTEAKQYKDNCLNNSIMNSSTNTMTSSKIILDKTNIGNNPTDINQTVKQTNDSNHKLFKDFIKEEPKNEEELEPYNFQIIKILDIKKNDDEEESIKFCLKLKCGFYLTCGTKKMILYSEDFKNLKEFNNIEDILYNITEKKSNNDQYIELIACYYRHIYLITIDTKNKYKFNDKKYEVPNKKILFCVNIEDNYILAGINNAMNVFELFNDIIEQKKMFKLSNSSYITGKLIDSNYIALISNKILPDGENKMDIFDIKNNKLIDSIKDVPFNMSGCGITIMEIESEKKLLCPCKKYNSNEENAILIADLKIEEDKKINYKKYSTDNFEPYCFCQIYLSQKNNMVEIWEPSIFFFVGGFDNDQRIGLIKLFKFKEEKNIDIIFLQDIEIETNKNEFYRFNNAVNNIIQSENTGEFVMTTVDGSFCHLSRANLDIHINRERKKMKMKN